MGLILVPARSPEVWQQFLGEPEKHWRTGFSAKATAHAWHDASGFPEEIQSLFNSADDYNLRSVELLLAIPEHKVYLPPTRGHPSQNDVFALAKAANGELISIAVEAKVSEPFGRTVEEWSRATTPGKTQRLEFLTELLYLVDSPVAQIRYQLLHRLASAVLEADRFNAQYAVLVVQSFSQTDEWFDDFEAFLSLYQREARAGQIVHLFERNGIDVFAGWARGDSKYLDA